MIWNSPGSTNKSSSMNQSTALIPEGQRDVRGSLAWGREPVVFTNDGVGPPVDLTSWCAQPARSRLVSRNTPESAPDAMNPQRLTRNPLSRRTPALRLSPSNAPSREWAPAIIPSLHYVSGRSESVTLARAGHLLCRRYRNQSAYLDAYAVSSLSLNAPDISFR